MQFHHEFSESAHSQSTVTSLNASGQFCINYILIGCRQRLAQNYITSRNPRSLAHSPEMNYTTMKAAAAAQIGTKQAHTFQLKRSRRLRTHGAACIPFPIVRCVTFVPSTRAVTSRLRNAPAQHHEQSNRHRGRHHRQPDHLRHCRIALTDPHCVETQKKKTHTIPIKKPN